MYPNNKNSDVTQLLSKWKLGEVGALQELTPLVNAQLHQLAVQFMNKESHNHTLQATALVNEAFIKLSGAKVDWQNQVHFIAVAAKIMRRILVDHAKAKCSQKRSSGLKLSLEIESNVADETMLLEDIVIVDELLEKLAIFDHRASQVLEFSIFGGLSNPEIAKTMKLSLSTIERELRVAKAWVNKSR